MPWSLLRVRRYDGYDLVKPHGRLSESTGMMYNHNRPYGHCIFNHHICYLFIIKLYELLFTSCNSDTLTTDIITLETLSFPPCNGGRVTAQDIVTLQECNCTPAIILHIYYSIIFIYPRLQPYLPLYSYTRLYTDVRSYTIIALY
jgi:hypothetical protein